MKKNLHLITSVDKRIDQIVANVYSLIGILFRGFVSRNLNVFKQACVTYIRPHLECVECMVSSFNYAYNFVRKTSSCAQFKFFRI